MKEKLEHKDIKYAAVIFEIITVMLWCLVLVNLYNYNIKPMLMLVLSAILFFVCTMSLLTERNNMLWE